LSRRYPEEVLEKMIYMTGLSGAAVFDLGQVRQWFEELSLRLNSDSDPSVRYSAALEQDGETQAFRARLTKRTHGITHDIVIPSEFFDSAEYGRLMELGTQLEGLIGEGAYVQRGDRRADVISFKQVISWLMDEAKRGQHIQRYKGLGEMNPNQLWETTMDPDTRRLLQVKIEDAVAADQIFTTLMGDHVEPRRDFIERNALEATNLDV
jgi:DNA gyrase subunit B